MRLMLRPAAALAVFLAVSAGGWAPASADWAIMYYDKEGRLVDLRTDRRNEFGGSGGIQSVPRLSGNSTQLDNEEADYRTGEIVVANPPRTFERSIGRLGFSILEKHSLQALVLDVYRLRIPQGSTVPAALTRLRRQFPGLVVDANHNLGPSAGRGTPEQLARGMMGWAAPPAGCGRGVRLGTVDGAVDLRHPALAGRRIAYRSFHSKGRRPGAVDHGTAIAAMIVGAESWGGLLPAAQLNAANIFEIDERGRLSASVFALTKAVDWLIGERVQVINLSVSGSENQVLSEILDRARAHGAVLVAAAGNDGIEAEPAYPAAYEHVIAVTAVDAGRGIYLHANRGSYIDFAAPGVAVWTAVPGGGRLQSGTSFAVPFVSVLAALEIAGGTAPNAVAARKRLRAQTIDLGAPGRDEVFGWGLVRTRRNCGVPVRG